eukprot:686751-Amphidinium_carterae.1
MEQCQTKQMTLKKVVTKLHSKKQDHIQLDMSFGVDVSLAEMGAESGRRLRLESFVLIVTPSQHNMVPLKECIREIEALMNS